MLADEFVDSTVTTKLHKLATEYNKETIQLNAKISGIKGSINKAKVANREHDDLNRRIVELLEVLKTRTVKYTLLLNMLDASKSVSGIKCNTITTVSYNGIELSFESGALT